MRKSEKPETYRQRNWRRLGIPMDYERWKTIATQCRICGTTENLVPDHNHSTHQFRGVLCSKCNTGLGLFRDNPQYLRCAELYLGGTPCH